jgi:hypothetical protein
LPDGTEVSVRYENSQVASCTASKTANDGKTVTVHYSKDGIPFREEHSFGSLTELFLVRRFERDLLRDEQYLYRYRLIARAKYERLRAAHPNMPPPTHEAVDPVAEMAALLRAEVREKRRGEKQHVANPERAAKLDAFCRQMLTSGAPQDVSTWIQEPGTTLGERDRRASRALASRLFAQGAQHVWACEVDQTEPGRQNTGHLVVQLPLAAEQRKALLRTLDRLAREQGYEGDFDDGQMFAYVKLD